MSTLFCTTPVITFTTLALTNPPPASRQAEHAREDAHDHN